MFLLDKITDLACFRAASYAEAGVDISGLWATTWACKARS